MILYTTNIFCFVKNAILCATKANQAAKQLVAFCSFILLSFAAKAQPCPTGISNNTIQMRPAQCVGTVATLQGSNPTGGNGTYTYQWQKSVGNCGSGNFSDITGATNRDYAIPASTANNDCFRRIVRSGTCSPSISNSEKLDNSDRTTPAAPTTTAVGSTCLAATGIITVSSPAPAPGIFYSIDGSNYTNTNGIFSGISAGTYSVTVKYPAGCFSPVRTQVLSSFPPISGNITPAIATFCVGDSQVLTVNGGNSYQWYKDNNAITGATSNKFTAKEAGVYTADIIAGTCTVKASNSVTVTVNPLPTGTISPNPVTLCAGSSATLTATGGTSYQWYRNGTLLSGQTAATISVTQQGVYTADIINSFGCKAKASNSSEVTVVTMPSGTITPATGTLCGGGTIQLSVSGGTSYQWYQNGTAINNATGPTYTAASGGTYTVDIIAGTCTTQASNSAVITQLSQSATISPANATLCPGRNVPLTISGATGSIQWYRDNLKIDGATSSTYPANQQGTYSVMIINGSCSTQATNTAVVSMGVNPSGIVDPPSASLCPGKSVTLTAIAAGGGYTFQWVKNGQFLHDSTSSTLITKETGNYSVHFSNGSCEAFSQNIVFVSESAPITFTATPAHLECTSPSGSITISGVSGGGASVYRYSKDNGATFQTSGNFSNLAAGTYQIVVRDTAGCVSTPRTITIQQNGFPPTLRITDPPRICPDQTANLQAASITVGSDNGLTFTYWRDTTVTTPVTNPGAVSPGKYFIKATSSFGCVAIKPVTVTAHTVTPGSISPTAPPMACFNTPVELKASNGTSYQWYRNDTIIAGATLLTYKALTAGEYSVFISNGICAVPASNKVKVTFQPCLPDAKVFVPTAFTPNKNGANDVLRPILYNIMELKYFKVYNRWGQEVFQTNEAGKGWDGTLKGSPQPSETYSWILECVGKNGDVIKQSGRSLLIR